MLEEKDETTVTFISKRRYSRTQLISEKMHLQNSASCLRFLFELIFRQLEDSQEKEKKEKDEFESDVACQ